MAMISMGMAARMAGVGKTTLSRAIKSGKLSAERQADGSYRIEPSELARVFTLKVAGGAGEQVPGHLDTLTVAHRETPQAEPSGHPGTADEARLEAEIAGLKALLEEVRASRDEARSERDHWREQTNRLLSSLPAPAPGGRVETNGGGWLRRIFR